MSLSRTQRPTRADAVGKLEWIVNVDATVNNRAHQPFAGQ
jgi:hypothetical protein